MLDYIYSSFGELYLNVKIGSRALIIVIYYSRLGFA